MKGMWVGYDVGCTMGLTCGHGAWQIDRQSSGSMWNSYSFQPVGQWMSYSFTDLGAEGCCRSLNALFVFGIPMSNLICTYIMPLPESLHVSWVKKVKFCIFSCAQAALRTLLSVCLSICLCVCLSFSGDITINKSDVPAKGQGQRSRSQRSKQVLP